MADDAFEDIDIDLATLLRPQDSGSKPVSQARDIAIDAIARQFLDVTEVNLEMHAYLIQTTLPTLVLSLEKLLVEMSRRGVQPDENGDLVLSSGLSMLSQTSDAASLQTGGDAAPAAEAALEEQVDKPRERFDALNWLAQHLYRNNPSFSNLYERTSSSYLKSMQTVAERLRKKIADIAAFQDAKRHAEEKARKEEEERKRLARLARIEENRRVFESLLSSIYKIWITSIWRKPPGQLYRREIIEEFTEASKTNAIQADADLYRKVARLISCISTEQVSTIMEIPEDNIIFDTVDPVYTLDPATIERWDAEFFVKMFLKLMCMWSVNELSNFLRVLSSMLTSRGPTLAATFKEVLYVPKFSLGESATIRDWLEELLPVVEIIKIDDSLHGEAVQRVLKDFCLGKADPRFQLTVEDEMAPNPDDYTSVAETMYKGFVKSILGEFGPSAYRALMTALRKEIEEEQRLAEKRTKKSGEDQAATLKATTRRQALARLLEVVQDCMRQDGLVDVPAFLRIVTAGIDSSKAKSAQEGSDQDSNANARYHDMLANLRSHIGAMDKISTEQLLNKIESAVHDDSNSLLHLLSLLVQARNAVKEADALATTDASEQPSIDRAGIEQIALDEIESLRDRMDMTIHSACEIFIEIIGEALQKLHPEHQVAARISLVETAITRISDGREKFGEGESIEGKGIVESFLRTVAASQHLKRVLLGRTSNEGSGIDYQIMAIGREMLIENAHTDPVTSEDLMIKESRPGSPHNMGFHFLGIPLISDQSKPVGAFDILMKGPSKFAPEDTVFFGRAVGLLMDLLAVIDNRSRAIELAKSAKSYFSARCETAIDLFLVESGAHGRHPEIFRIEDVSPTSTLEWQDREDVHAPQASPYLRPWTSKLSKITEESEDADKDRLLKVYTERKAASVPSDQDGFMYVPVQDEEGKCVAIVSLKIEKSMPHVPERAREVERIGSLLGSAISTLRKNTFGSPVKLADFSLDADKIDENTRRRMLFGKVMLATVRDYLLRIDAKALAELRSYKKPPKSVHRLVKGVLYVFGKTPKEVKQWMDAIRLLTMDFLKAMAQYDPTAVQKKVRILRAKRAIRGVSFKEQGDKYGVNSPAQFLHDWLVVILELRDLAVAARRARPDIFDRPASDPTPSEIDAEEGISGSTSLSGLGLDEEDEGEGGDGQDTLLQREPSIIDETHMGDAYKIRFGDDGVEVDKQSAPNVQQAAQNVADLAAADESSKRSQSDQPPI